MPEAEIEAMAKVAEALADLQEDERGRVLRWASERYGITVSTRATPSNKVEDEDGGLDEADVDHGAHGSRQNGKFEHFAEFYDAIGPKTDPERVLVASYWATVHQGKTTFGSQELNTQLKDLGHGVSAINKAMTANINKKPALILQVTRGGSVQQARKKYKVTEAGKKWITARLGCKYSEVL
jgi:hypothetical protein